jgi:arginine/lysine/ornithine decarboxylase
MTVRLTQTTSPSLPILAGLDACRQQMVLEGECLLERAIGLAFAARRRLGALPGISVLGARELADVAFDPTRLVIDVQGLGMTGFAAERILRSRFGIAPAMSERAGVVYAITIGDTPHSLDWLVAAFAALAGGWATNGAGHERSGAWGYRALLMPRRQVCSPRDGFFSRSRTVPIADAIGHVAAELVIPYPPGIPAVVPGELIAAETVAYLRDGGRQGMHLRGVADPTLATIRIVAGEATL